MKKQTILFSLLVLMSIPAYSQVSDNRLGTVIATERTYSIHLQQLQANLKVDTLKQSWVSEVVVSPDGKDVVSNLKNVDYFTSVDSVNVIVMVLPDSYRAYVSKGAMSTVLPTKEQAEAALAYAFEKLQLNGKTHTLKFLKIDR